MSVSSGKISLASVNLVIHGSFDLLRGLEPASLAITSWRIVAAYKISAIMHDARVPRMVSHR